MQRYQGRMFDGDSHIYERADAWTRHLPERFREHYTITHRKKDNGNLGLYIGDVEVSTSDGYMRYDANGVGQDALL